jgi:glycine hydroxymethyltransferase
MHVIAAKAVAFGEALKPEFKVYSQQVIDNAKVLAKTLLDGGYAITTGGTDNHLMLVDLRPKKLNGKISEASLEQAGMTCNKNGIPFDTEKPTITSGVRLGTPAATTRGFGTEEFKQVGQMIVKVLDALAANPQNNGAVEQEVRKEVSALCKRFPIYNS